MTWFGSQLGALGIVGGGLDRGRLAALVENHLARPVSGGLRPHQREALEGIAGRLRTPDASPTSITVIPTAGGKTRIFLHLARALHEDRTRTHRTVMLVPTRELIGQTWRELRHLFPQMDVGYLASSEIVDEAGHRVRRRVGATTLMSYQRFIRMAARGEVAPEDLDVVVMDEAHRALSDLRQDVVAAFKDRVLMAAFTATPSFDDEKSLQSLLGAENETLVVTPKRLRDAGVIAPVVNLVLGIDLRGELPKDQQQSVLLRRKALVDTALDLVETHVDDEIGIALRDKVALFYGTDIAHARMFVDEYNARFGSSGRAAVLVTGRDEAGHLRQAVRGVREGTVTAFGNAQLLVEGFDLPSIGLAINAPTQSLVKQLQQSGRAQRIDPALSADDARQTAYVLDCFYRINDRIVGKPKFYFDAVGDPSVARIIQGPAIPVDSVDLAALADEDYRPVEIAGDEVGAGGDADGPATAVDRGTGVAVDGPGPLARPDRPDRRRRDASEFKDVALDVSGRMDAVFRFMRERSRLDAPPKTDEWLAMQEAAAAARVAPERVEFRDAWAAACLAVAEGRPPEVNGRLLRFEDRISGRNAVTCLHAGDVPDLCAALSLPDPATPRVGPGDLVREGIARAVGCGLNDPSFASAYDMLREALSEGGGTRLAAMEIEAGWRRYGTWVVPAITEASVDGFARLMGWKGRRPLKGDDWLTSHDVKKALGISDKNRRYSETWRSLVDAHERDALAKEFPGVRFGMVRSGPTTHLAIHRDSLAWLAPRLGRSERGQRAKGADWLSVWETCARIPVPPSYDAAAKALFEGWTATIEEGGTPALPDGPVRVEYRTSVSKTVVCAHESELDRISAALGLTARLSVADKTEEWLSMTGAANLGGLSNRNLSEIWEAMGKVHDAGGTPLLGGKPVRVAMLRAGAHVALNLHRDDLNHLRAEVGLGPLRLELPEAGPDDLTKAKVAAALGISVMGGNFKGIWSRLVEGHRDGISTVEGRSLRFGEFRRGSVAEFYLHRECLPWFDEAFKDGLGHGVRNKGEDWLTAKEASLIVGASEANRDYVAAWAAAVSEAEAGKPPFRMERRRSGSRAVWCLHRDAAPDLRAALPPSAIIRPMRDAVSEEEEAAPVARRA